MPGFHPHVTYVRNVANLTFTYFPLVLCMFRKKFRAVTAVRSVTSAAAQVGLISIFHVSAVCFSQ